MEIRMGLTGAIGKRRFPARTQERNTPVKRSAEKIPQEKSTPTSAAYGYGAMMRLMSDLRQGGDVGPAMESYQDRLRRVTR